VDEGEGKGGGDSRGGQCNVRLLDLVMKRYPEMVREKLIPRWLKVRELIMNVDDLKICFGWRDSSFVVRVDCD
jgi:hypothetical protein